jgi:hypothetical protein
MSGILSLALPVLAIAAIYCLWYRYSQTLRQHQRELCQRVAQLVLAVATRKPKRGKRSARKRVQGEPEALPPKAEGAAPDQPAFNAERA